MGLQGYQMLIQLFIYMFMVCTDDYTNTKYIMYNIGAQCTSYTVYYYLDYAALAYYGMPCITQYAPHSNIIQIQITSSILSLLGLTSVLFDTFNHAFNSIDATRPFC